MLLPDQNMNSLFMLKTFIKPETIILKNMIKCIKIPPAKTTRLIAVIIL